VSDLTSHKNMLEVLRGRVSDANAAIDAAPQSDATTEELTNDSRTSTPSPLPSQQSQLRGTEAATQPLQPLPPTPLSSVIAPSSATKSVVAPISTMGVVQSSSSDRTTSDGVSDDATDVVTDGINALNVTLSEEMSTPEADEGTSTKSLSQHSSLKKHGTKRKARSKSNKTLMKHRRGKLQLQNSDATIANATPTPQNNSSDEDIDEEKDIVPMNGKAIIEGEEELTPPMKKQRSRTSRRRVISDGDDGDGETSNIDDGAAFRSNGTTARHDEVASIPSASTSPNIGGDSAIMKTTNGSDDSHNSNMNNNTNIDDSCNVPNKPKKKTTTISSIIDRSDREAPIQKRKPRGSAVTATTTVMTSSGDGGHNLLSIKKPVASLAKGKKQKKSSDDNDNDDDNEHDRDNEKKDATNPTVAAITSILSNTTLRSRRQPSSGHDNKSTGSGVDDDDGDNEHVPDEFDFDFSGITAKSKQASSLRSSKKSSGKGTLALASTKGKAKSKANGKGKSKGAAKAKTKVKGKSKAKTKAKSKAKSKGKTKSSKKDSHHDSNDNDNGNGNSEDDFKKDTSGKISQKDTSKSTKDTSGGAGRTKKKGKVNREVAALISESLHDKVISSNITTNGDTDKVKSKSKKKDKDRDNSNSVIRDEDERIMKKEDGDVNDTNLDDGNEPTTIPEAVVDVSGTNETSAPSVSAPMETKDDSNVAKEPTPLSSPTIPITPSLIEPTTPQILPSETNKLLSSPNIPATNDEPDEPDTIEEEAVVVAAIQVTTAEVAETSISPQAGIRIVAPSPTLLPLPKNPPMHVPRLRYAVVHSR
jgi:hypothetical protein